MMLLVTKTQLMHRHGDVPYRENSTDVHWEYFLIKATTPLFCECSETHDATLSLWLINLNSLSCSLQHSAQKSLISLTKHKQQRSYFHKEFTVKVSTCENHKYLNVESLLQIDTPTKTGWPCDQNIPRRKGQCEWHKSFLAISMGKQFTSCPLTRWWEYISYLERSCLGIVQELSEVAEDHGVFWELLQVLPHNQQKLVWSQWCTYDY